MVVVDVGVWLVIERTVPGSCKHDAVTYDEYVARAMLSLENYGVEVLAVSDEPRAVESSGACGRYVLLRLSDHAAFVAWCKSPEYQAARPQRNSS